MLRCCFLMLLPLGIGCTVSAPAEKEPARGAQPIAEWHASERAFELDPLREDVVVWSDGRVDARFRTNGVLAGWKEFAPKQRCYDLSPVQVDQLFVLLSDAKFLKCDDVDADLRGCPPEPLEPDFVRDVILVYSPRPGFRRELRRSWVDGQREGLALARDFSDHLESLDRFFRELLWKE